MRVSDLQIEIGKTLAHELLHHWELRSGIDDLGDEDREKLLIWKEKTGNVKNASLGQNLIEIALYIYLIFILIAFLARVIR
jgi:hypothetical protein